LELRLTGVGAGVGGGVLKQEVIVARPPRKFDDDSMKGGSKVDTIEQPTTCFLPTDIPGPDKSSEVGRTVVVNRHLMSR
jgi:hypothetical protein